MHRFLARCPYCDRGEVLVDYYRPVLVFDRGGAKAKPCPHLAFLSAALGVYPAKSEDMVDERSGNWFYVLGKGLRDMPLHGPLDSLMDFIDHLACDLLPDDELYPDVEYQVVGGPCSDLISGCEFAIHDAPGTRLQAILDGWAIYSCRPAQLVKVAQEIAGHHWDGDLATLHPSD